MPKIFQSGYENIFGIKGKADKSKVEKALKYAIENRKFEIELYWKRTAYFWTLIAIAFAGYCTMMESVKNNQLYALVIACVGFTFSVACYFVNKGSKHWQENWENHVDLLENEVIGPLYKTNIFRPEDDTELSRVLLGPDAYSVSKINMLVSLFTIFIWGVLVINSIPSALKRLLYERMIFIAGGVNDCFECIPKLSIIFGRYWPFIPHIITLVLTVIFSFCIWEYGKTDKPKGFGFNNSAYLRISRIKDPEK